MLKKQRKPSRSPGATCDHGCDHPTWQIPAFQFPERPVWVLRWLRSLWAHFIPSRNPFQTVGLSWLVFISRSGWFTLMCPLCMGCSIASDMDECCLCGLGMPIRSVYRTKYNIKVRSQCLCREKSCFLLNISYWDLIRLLYFPQNEL